MSASVLEKSIQGPAAWNQGIEKSRVPSLVRLHDTSQVTGKECLKISMIETRVNRDLWSSELLCAIGISELSSGSWLGL